ncbi:hypothetical protein V8C86DRAFT_2529825 [Haematococcus lacustris]
MSPLSDFIEFEDGTILWTASLILLNHLQTHEAQSLRGKRVLELGSGLGHLGMGLARLGAHVTCTERPRELSALQASLALQQQQTSGVLEAALALYGRASAATAAPLKQPTASLSCPSTASMPNSHEHVAMSMLPRASGHEHGPEPAHAGANAGSLIPYACEASQRHQHSINVQHEDMSLQSTSQLLASNAKEQAFGPLGLSACVAVAAAAATTAAAAAAPPAAVALPTGSAEGSKQSSQEQEQGHGRGNCVAAQRASRLPGPIQATEQDGLEPACDVARGGSPPLDQPTAAAINAATAASTLDLLPAQQHAGDDCTAAAVSVADHVQQGAPGSSPVAEALCTAAGGSVCTAGLLWGEKGFEQSPLSTQQLPVFDVIICSELYYIEALFPELLWTLRRLSGPHTVIWSIFIDRPFSFLYFALLADEGCWEVEAIQDFDDLGLEPELQVHMHRVRLQPGAKPWA